MKILKAKKALSRSVTHPSTPQNRAFHFSLPTQKGPHKAMGSFCFPLDTPSRHLYYNGVT